MRDLDFYVSTPDEHFNHNAQNFYFLFTGNGKPETEKPFEVFIDAIYEAYFFAFENLNKPFACVQKIKELSVQNNFNDLERIIFVNLLLGVISNYPDSNMISKIYIQFVDYRHDLKPFDTDEDILERMNRKYTFDIEEIKEHVKSIIKPSDKIIYFGHLLFDIRSKRFEMDDSEWEYYVAIGLLHYINVEVDRAAFEINVNKTKTSTSLSDSSNQSQLLTQSDKMLNHLSEFGFLEVPKVKILSKEKQANLIELIATNKLPYCVAMFEYLGYLKYLRENHFKTDVQRNTDIASWFDTDERSVKGNIAVLDEYSGDNRNRYTAHNFKQNAEKDYLELK